MAKKIIILAVVLPALAAGVYWGGERLLNKSANAVLDRLEASLPEGATLAHGALTTNLLRREVVLSGFEVKAPDAVGARTLSATSLRLAGLPWLTRGSFELGELVVEGLRVERNGIVTAGRWAITRPGVQVLNQLAATDRAIGQFSFAAAEVNDLTVQRSNPVLNVKVDYIRSGALAGGILQDVVMSGIHAESQDVSGPLVKLGLEKLTADDVDITRVLAADGNIDLTAPVFSNSVSALAISKLTLGPDGGQPITLSGLTLGGAGLADGTRTAIDIKVEELITPTAAMSAPARRHYEALGYQRMAINLDLAGEYNPQTRLATLNRFNFVALNAATVSLKLALGGIAKPENRPFDQAAAQDMLSTATLNLFDLAVTDSGYVKRQVAMGAKQLEVEPDIYVGQLINRIRPPAGATGEGAQKLASLYRAVSSFLLNPGELTISAKPENPVLFMQMLMGLGNLPALAETINISAANRQLRQSSTAE